ncbi:rho GTPase-activating protein 11A-like isoform X2 [Trichogramma pretiosum]|uniref:rho GTPase-activating protein 11A-like isoform X2 n=1 Tax=Trichogramma pretiosum TaxID=7493 RepID=UPI0006C9DA3B|nr:rho GTPase-activating protein 11A-like isoform X2 [Trichogramma pretiosum]
MLIYDVLHKEKVYSIVANNLRTLGVKYRIKKNAIKTDKPDRNAVALKKVFKTPLSYLPLDVVNLSSGAIVHVPVFVSQATAFLLKHVNQEGLFRKAGLQVKQKEIIARLDNGGSLGDKYNPLDVANCFKTFLRSLPEPLIPFSYHDVFVRCGMLKEKKEEALLMACLLLPPHHLNTLAFIMEFLKTVSQHETQNKMGIDNLARVVGPNIMPLPDTSTIVAVQTRLEAHLNIIKILIENSEKIGVLPDDVSSAINMDAVGSTDELDIDKSDPSALFKSKKKKHRSGSLNRMISGLRKMVGKNHSPSGTETQENHIVAEPTTQSHTPSVKVGKKRKNNDQSHLRRQTDFFEILSPSCSYSFSSIFSPQVSEHPNPVRESQKAQKHKISTEQKLPEKVERPKKLRLSLDRLVPRSHKNKSNGLDDSVESRKKSFSPESRWLTGSSAEAKKRRRTKSIDSPYRRSPRAKVPHAEANEQSHEDVFMDAEINLSDDCANSKRRSSHNYSLRSLSSPNTSTATDDNNGEYVKIPKSEYEEIKTRVSAIESRISQEFKSITNEATETLISHPITKVQSEYENLLEETNIENSASADQLAKRLSRELKIRKSSEHKIIRSPSARKIGSMRRRSQEKPVRKVQRTVSWHISDKSLNRTSVVSAQPRVNSLALSPNKPCKLARSKPLLKRDSYKSLTQTPTKPEHMSSDNLSAETNARLEYLQQQLNTLISHTAEHTRGAFSDDDFLPLDDSYENKKSAKHESPIRDGDSVNLRRASSFNDENFIDNSQYFNDKLTEVLRGNALKNPSVSPSPNKEPKTVLKTPGTGRKEKTVSWKDADDYFQQEAKLRTPVPTTGRASVAKLRTQNAGMVLAKAKLFDDPTKEAIDFNRRQSMKAQNPSRNSTRDEMKSTSAIKRREEAMRRKQTTPDRRGTKNVSPLIRMEVSISSNGRKQSTRLTSPRVNHEDTKNLVLKENKSMQAVNALITNPSTVKQEDANLLKISESPLCKTPHIKRPLSVKTPRSAKSLSARKSIMLSRRTPLKAMMPITPKRQSPRITMKSSQLNRHN